MSLLTVMVHRYLSLLLFFSLIAPCYLHPANKPTFKTLSASAFIENKGQIIDQHNKLNPSVLYLLNSPGFNVQLRKNGFSYDLYRISNIDQRNMKSELERTHHLTSSPSAAGGHQFSSSIEYHRIDFDLLNANPDPTIVTSDPSRDYQNYYTPGTPEKGVTFVRHYKTIIYKNIYPNIDLEFLADEQKGFKYNFVVRPGGDLKAIRMEIVGPETELSSSGSLFLKTTLGTIEEKIPDCMYQQNAIESVIDCHFKQISTDVFSFSLQNEFPDDATLFIDPIPIRMWGTYYGGSQGDALRWMTADHDSNVILCGTTYSLDYIATAGAFKTTSSGGEDGFLAKFNTNGQIIWGTYYGGWWTETFGCATDTAGDIYIHGTTGSNSGIATSGSYQTTYGGGYSDTYIAKFTPGGQRVWGTYYGGEDQDEADCIFIDALGRVYVTGTTSSLTGIATPGAFKTFPSGAYDTYLARFDSSGSFIEWGTYYGGSNTEYGSSIAADSFHNVYLAGTTFSSDNISTGGSFQPLLGGADDGFLVAFDPSGSRIWATYYGGLGSDGIGWVGISKDNELYISGYTSSNTNIATTGSYQSTLHGSEDSFLAKFLLSGSRVWGTYFGGDGVDEDAVGAINDSSYIYISANTHSSNLIATPGAFLSTYLGSYYLYIAKFDPDGTRLWATYFGDTLQSTGYEQHVATVGDGIIYLAASTFLPTYCATPGVYQTFNRGGVWAGDAFVEKFYDCKYPGSTGPITGSVSVCKNTTGITYSVQPVFRATGYSWNLPPGFKIINGLNTNVITIVVKNFAISGIISASAYNSCGSIDTATLSVTVYDDPVIMISGFDTVCQENPSLFSTSPGKTNYLWSVSPGGNIIAGGTTTSNTITVSWSNTGANWVSVNFTDANGCTDTIPSTHKVWVKTGNPVGISISSSENNICEGTSVTFTALPSNGGLSPSFQWKVNGINAGMNSPFFTYYPSNGDQVSCILTSSAICTSNNPATSNTITIIVNPNLLVSINISPSQNPICNGTPVIFTAMPTNQGSSPFFQWKVNSTYTGTNSSTFTYSPMNIDTVTCVLTSSDTTCISNNPASSNKIIMIVNPNLPVSISISASANPVCSGIAVTYTATPVNGGSSPIYQWKVNGANVGANSNLNTYNPVSGDLVSCILTSNIICPIGNPATSNTIIMNVPSSPVVTFTLCNDYVTTTNAKPFKLKGGLPLNGTYSGPGVNNGIFSPALAGTGTKTIIYTYSNAALCSATATRTITVLSPGAFVCGNNLTDIRDTKVYPTIQIGAQCWMAANLDYGNLIPGNASQRDNCIWEKYCYNDVNANCGMQTYYQWDEVMQYDETVSIQGLCPPGWHVPTEADWNTLFAEYINNAFAAGPLKYSGFSGFNALLSGTRYINKSWDLQGFATFFWSSTSHGATKAWAHGMNDVDPSVSLYPAFRNNAFSVRCLKD